MKAVRLHGHGGIEQLCCGEVEDPQLESADDVVVRLRAAALNRHDLSIRRGETRTKISLPLVPGSDGAGTVVAVGDRVKSLKAGDAVCVYPWIACRQCAGCVAGGDATCERAEMLGEARDGTYAEYIRVPAKNCAPIPAGLSFEEAAALPFAFVNAWRMLITNAELKPGESVFISGIGGCVATAALQLATRMGSPVIAGSDSDEQLAKALRWGAAHGINYKTEDLPAAVRRLTRKRGVDVAVDGVGGDCWAKSLASLAKGGRLVSCGVSDHARPLTDLRRIFWNHLKIFGSSAGSRAEFYQVLNFMAFSQTRPIVDRVFPLKDAAQAQQYMEERRQLGKIVLRMDD